MDNAGEADWDCDMAEEKKSTQASREGLVNLAFWTTPELRLAVRKLALDLGKSVQDVMDEAVRDLLAKHGRKVKR